jgi:hypothetical protein
MSRFRRGLQRMQSRVVRFCRSESGEGAVSQVLVIGVAAVVLICLLTLVGVNGNGTLAETGLMRVVWNYIADLFSHN